MGLIALYSTSWENLASKKLAVKVGATLVGIGGLNIDPFDGTGTTGRLRRLYVDPTCRGRGMGKTLVRALEICAAQSFVTLRLFTDDAEAARFYLALGYSAVSSDGKASHQKILTKKQGNQRSKACCSH